MATFLSIIAVVVLSIGVARAVVKVIRSLSEDRRSGTIVVSARNVAGRDIIIKVRSEISVAHPKRLSKGEDSKIIVAVHPEELRKLAHAQSFDLLDNEVSKGVDTHSFSLEIEALEPILVKLSSQYIDFIPQEGERIIPSQEVISIQFIATPKEVSRPGKRIVRISVTKKESEESKDELLLLNETFKIHVDDYAFDHVSRPLITKAGATMSAVAGLSSYALTLLEQVDKTTGLTAGTAFFVLLGILASINHILYRRPTTTTVTTP